MPPIRISLTGNSEPISVEDFRRMARRKLPDMVWAYVEGGADDLGTLRGNRNAFDRWSLRTRVLTGGDGSDIGVTVGDVPLSMPVFLSPTGMTGLVRSAGEVAAARAAERAGTRAVISTAASYTVEEVAAATEEQHFFQLYPWTSQRTGEPLANTFIRRAKDAGFGALFVTLDVPVAGNREAERRTGMGVNPTLTPLAALKAATRPRWCYEFLRHQRVAARMLVDERGTAAGIKSAKAQTRMMTPDITWEDLAKVRDLWEGPLYVKGVLDPEDATKAVELGADGVMVSNHGGRQLDGALASLDALPAVVEAVGSRAKVYLDGGIRRGSDVVKALCLGADAVAIGRPYVYGLAARGQVGVEQVLGILREEITRTLTLMGVGSISDLKRSHLIRN